MAEKQTDGWLGKITKEVVAMVVGAAGGSGVVIGFMNAVIEQIQAIADAKGWWVYIGFGVMGASFPIMLVLLVELYFQRRRENERRVIRSLTDARALGIQLRDALIGAMDISPDVEENIRKWTASVIPDLEAFAPRQVDQFRNLGAVQFMTLGDPTRPQHVILEEACLTERLTRLGAIIRGDNV